MPLEGFEHVLSILHSDAKRRNPRSYADFSERSAIQRRPKTASWKWNVGKKRVRVTSAGAVIRRMPETNAGKNEFGLRKTRLI